MWRHSLFLSAVQLLHELVSFIDDRQQFFQQQLLALLLSVCLLPIYNPASVRHSYVTACEVMTSDENKPSLLIDAQSRENIRSTARAICACLNNIRLYCKNARALIVLSGQCDFESETLAAETLKSNLGDFLDLSDFDVTQQVRVVTNERTCFPLFNSVDHATELCENLERNLCDVSQGRFPLIALRLNEMLKKRHEVTITQTDVSNSLAALGIEKVYCQDF